MSLRVVVGVIAISSICACATSSAPVDSTPPAASTATATAAASDAPPTATATATAIATAITVGPGPGTTTAAAAPPDPNACALVAGKWDACVEKLVEVRGQAPKMVYQHPMIAPMFMPGSDKPKVRQSYIETSGGSQVIVLSTQANDCTGPMRVKGTLRSIDMGGPSGTKSSYKGWAIHDAVIVCE